LLAASAIMTALKSFPFFNSSQSDNSTNTFNDKNLILYHTNGDHFVTGVNLSREIKLRLQTATHTAMDHIDQCVEALNAILPTYLTGISQQIVSLLPPSPDSTTNPNLQKLPEEQFMTIYPNLPSPPESDISTSNSTILPAHSLDKRCSQSPDLDLICDEHISNDLTQDFQSNFSEDFASRSSFGHEDSNGASPPYSLGTNTSRSSSPLSAVDIFTEYNTNVLQAIFDQADELEPPYSILVS
jgi:hypothetical protein